MRRLLSSILLLMLVLPAWAQEDRLLSPSEFLGYELGSRFTPHHRVVNYVEHVAAHTPHLRLMHYGETYEGRPLVLAILSSPEQMARIDEIREENLRRIGLLDGPAPDGGPALVWLSYNVHGNESVSTEAAMATLYDLADPQNARTQAWLAEAVVLLDPCINPDGRERYVNWYNRTVGRFPDPDPAAREHHEPWPGGRTNHYYFDLNRDWAWGTQAETQQRLTLYNRWMPHVHVDFHEQGVDAPYYFAPAAEPYHPAITAWQRELQTHIGRNHARYFDAAGWLYFTRQVFDLFYPGYGDTWPTFNGAVGMTYEQGGSGRAGLAIRTAEGDTLTLAERIAHHHTTSLSTVEAAAQNRARIVEEFAAYFDASAPRGAYETFVVKHTNDADKLAALASHLEQQGIAAGYATRRRTARGLRYTDGTMGTVEVEPGDLVVSTRQPKGVLASVLFEPEAALSDSLSYDITAWALPYVYGLDAYAVAEALDVAPAAAPPPAPAPPEAGAQPYAYLAAWKSFEDARLLARLLRAGVRVRFTREPFQIDGRTYDRGTLIITRTGNEHLGARLDATVRAAAAEGGQPLHAVETGFVTAGPDFGSADVSFLERPSVAVLAGSPLSAYSVGEVWHFFDQQLGYPVTLIDPDDFGSLRLADYDVLVLPGGSYGTVLSEERLGELKAWIREGGRLVALEGAARFLAGKDGFALQRAGAEEDEENETPDRARLLRPYAERHRDAISRDVTGAVFRVRLDTTHPLAFGYDATTFTLKRHEAPYAFLAEGWNVGILEADAHVSGFVGSRAREALGETLVFGVQEMGRGTVVYLLDDPLFRGFWYAGRLLFTNAVFFVR